MQEEIGDLADYSKITDSEIHVADKGKHHVVHVVNVWHVHCTHLNTCTYWPCT